MIPTNEWIEGYVFDVPYTANFYYYQAPDLLNFCCMLYGFAPPDIDNGFSYLELGSGMGFNLNLMAALYPQGNFVGVDFNPEHIRFSNEVKNKCNIENSTFLEVSFEEFLNKGGEFSSFDYIALHGVFSWVSHENREVISKIIKKKLKPGGICYVSYNNMCGWWSQIPFQRFLLDYTSLFPDFNSIQKINLAENLLKKLKDAEASYFNRPFMERLFKKIDKDNRAYIAHEYLNRDWQPLFFTDVLSYMGRAMVNYIGSADPIWYFENIFLTEKQFNLLKGLRSPMLKEIVKDYMVELAFRKDIYMKGRANLSGDSLINKFKEVNLFLRPLPDEKKYKVNIGYSKRGINLDPEFVERIVEHLIQGPKTIGYMLDKKIFKNISDAVRTISLLLHTRLLDVIIGNIKENKNTIRNINKYVALHTRENNILRHIGIPESRSGIMLGIIQRLVYDAILNEDLKDIDKIISHVKTYTSKFRIELSEEEIDKTITTTIEKDLPQWERIGILGSSD